MNLLTDNELSQIEEYLKGQLPPDEAAQVEKRIGEDPRFAEEVEWMRQMANLKTERKAFSVLNTFQEIHRRHRRRRIVRRLVVSGVAACLLAFLFFHLFGPEPELPADNGPEPTIAPAGEEPAPAPIEDVIPENEQPAAPPTTPQPNNPAPQKQPSSTSPPVAAKTVPPIDVDALIQYKEGIQTLKDESALGEAKKSMDQGKRVEALPMLEKYFDSLTEEEEDFELRLEAGKIYLKEVKNYERAAHHFRKVAEGDFIPRYKMEGRFYLACTYLAQGRAEEAKKLLNVVAAGSIEPWKTQAAELLKRF